MAVGAIAVGRWVVQAAGGPTVIIPRSCQVLGFFVQNASTTVQLYDAAATTGLPTSILNTGLLTLGWYPFPVDLVNGLVATTSGGTVIFVCL